MFNRTELKRITKNEDKAEGSVKKEVYISYIKYMGGILMFIGVMIRKL
jgi:hypothetical protein